MQIKARSIRCLTVALHWVPFLGSWLLMRLLDKAEERHIEERDEWESLAVYRMQKIEEQESMLADSDTLVAELETRNTKLRAFVAELEAEIDLLRESLSDNPRISQP